ISTKRLWRAEGLPTADFRVLENEAEARVAARALGTPFVIKPSSEGSSVGVSIVKQPAQVAAAFKLARGNGRTVMAERFIQGAEITVAVLGDRALPSIRIEPDGEFYDYHAKYISDKTKYHCPSGLPKAQEKKLGELARQAFTLIGARGWGRVDFILDARKKPWLLELNTVPGMTSHSLVPMAARAAGFSFDELCWAVLETSFDSAPGGARAR
ncbi:MAG: D-alanine--D-alanine ligase, partial [Nevskiales bacterium]|nr:D-alanine--D-alanine ligase [Nevskiales bacterium]